MSLWHRDVCGFSLSRGTRCLQRLERRIVLVTLVQTQSPINLVQSLFRITRVPQGSLQAFPRGIDSIRRCRGEFWVIGRIRRVKSVLGKRLKLRRCRLWVPSFIVDCPRDISIEYPATSKLWAKELEARFVGDKVILEDPLFRQQIQ
jgi:hypothetical protein